MISSIIAPGPAYANEADDSVPAVSGRIIDSDGAAVVGERVTLVRVTADYFGNVQTESAGSSLTGADGSYSISVSSGVSTDSYFRLMVATGPSSPFLDRTDGPIFAPRGAQTRVDLQLARAGSISGTVRDGSGRVVSGYVSLFRSPHDGTSGPVRTVRASSGFFSVPKVAPGEYLIKLSPSEEPATWWPSAASERDAASLRVEESKPYSVAITTIVTGTIAGTVTSVEGPMIDKTGPRSARVTAHRLDGDEFVLAGSSFVGDGGEYRLDVPPGRYALEFVGTDRFARNFTGGASLLSEADTFVVESGAVELLDAELDYGGTIEGSAEGASVVEVSDADGRVVGRVRLTSPYRITGLSAGEYTVHAYGEPLGDENYLHQWWPGAFTRDGATAIQIEAGESRTGLDFAASHGATFEGNVRVWEESWMPVGQAIVTGLATDGRALASTSSDVLGRFELNAVQPGVVRLRIESGSGHEWYWPAAKSFETAGTLTAKPSETIRGIVTGPEATVSDPVVSGTPAVGQTLTASSVSPVAGADITYRWGGRGFVDRVGPSLVVTPEMAGGGIVVTATATKLGHTTMTSKSVWLPERVLNWGKPWFGDGQAPAVGFPLRIFDSRGSTTGATATTRQWFANGVAIPGATGETFVPRLADEGKRLTVRTTGSAPGYADGSATSDPSTRVMKVGTPKVNGTARVGATLVADPGIWTTGLYVSYEWTIDGDWSGSQNERQFTVPADAVGKSIGIVAWGENEQAGYDRVFMYSAETPKVVAPRTPIIHGTPYVGSTLTADPGDWGVGAPIEYQWLVNGTSIPAATAKQYRPTTADAGKPITVRVRVSDRAWASATMTSAPTQKVALAPVPKVSGTARVGGKLTATPGTWTKGTTLTYQWYANGTAISKATSPSMTLPSSLAGKAITVKVTGRLLGYPTATRSSAATAKVTAWSPPTVSGSPKVGGTLTANPGAWTPGTSFAYQWYANGVAIPKATGKTFVPTAAQVGRTVAVRVNGSQVGFGSMTSTSPATSTKVALAPVPSISGTARVGARLIAVPGTWTTGTVLSSQWYADGIAIANATASSLVVPSSLAGKAITVRMSGRLAGYPTVTHASVPTARVIAWSTPTISGTTEVGATVTANPGVWSTGTSFAYQWYANGVAVSKATGRTFAPTPAQVGASLTVRVTGSQAGFGSASATSSPTMTKVALTAVPKVSGEARVGGMLTVSPGAWTTGTAYTYQWYADGVAMPARTTPSLALTGAQLGKTITVVVSGRLAGYPTLSERSAATGSIVVSGTPTLTGEAQVGATLSASPGDWTGVITFAYQWLANGVAIPGAAGVTYQVPPERLGQRITVKATTAETGVAVVSAVSAPTSAVVAGSIQAGAPTIIGVDNTLALDPGDWPALAALTFQWYRDGEPIADAHGTSLDIDGQSGSYRAEVTASATGYTTVTIASSEFVVPAAVPTEQPVGALAE
ncbi:carboxypeptidase-like regulatory domain-containing protein [Agromyces salentinus]|uniref:carboxypeptidase-like regulatory domain-containing protein n=1 Tax=Agromyces salentinus TaxID=269421 RepID=UPI0012FCD2FE|nr:carboxypeptidase-like regulatory domain-containing protein [Agromyces salentinus]